MLGLLLDFQFFKTGSHIYRAVLELAVSRRVTLNLCSCCLHLPSAEIKMCVTSHSLLSVGDLCMLGKHSVCRLNYIPPPPPCMLLTLNLRDLRVEPLVMDLLCLSPLKAETCSSHSSCGQYAQISLRVSFSLSWETSLSTIEKATLSLLCTKGVRKYSWQQVCIFSSGEIYLPISSCNYAFSVVCF